MLCLWGKSQFGARQGFTAQPQAAWSFRPVLGSGWCVLDPAWGELQRSPLQYLKSAWALGDAGWKWPKTQAVHQGRGRILAVWRRMQWDTLRHSPAGSSVPRPAGSTSISNSLRAMGRKGKLVGLVGLDTVEHLAENLGSLGISEQNLNFILLLRIRKIMLLSFFLLACLLACCLREFNASAPNTQVAKECPGSQPFCSALIVWSPLSGHQGGGTQVEILHCWSFVLGPEAGKTVAMKSPGWGFRY